MSTRVTLPTCRVDKENCRPENLPSRIVQSSEKLRSEPRSNQETPGIGARQHAFESALQRASGRQLLKVWTEYADWARGISVEEERQVLERACYALIDDPIFDDELGHLQLWVLYANRISNPVQVFRLLEEQEVGLKFSLFYEAWAIVLERQREFEEAEKMYERGVNVGAKPLPHLEEQQIKFRKRMEQRRRRDAKRLRTACSRDVDASFPGTKSIERFPEPHDGMAMQSQPTTIVQTEGMRTKAPPTAKLCDRRSLLSRKSSGEDTLFSVQELLAGDRRSLAGASMFEDPTCTLDLASKEILNLFANDIEPRMESRGPVQVGAGLPAQDALRDRNAFVPPSAWPTEAKPGVANCCTKQQAKVEANCSISLLSLSAVESSPRNVGPHSLSDASSPLAAPDSPMDPPSPYEIPPSMCPVQLLGKRATEIHQDTFDFEAANLAYDGNPSLGTALGPGFGSTARLPTGSGRGAFEIREDTGFQFPAFEPRDHLHT